MLLPPQQRTLKAQISTPYYETSSKLQIEIQKQDDSINTKALLHYVWKKNQGNIKFFSQTLKNHQNFILKGIYRLKKDQTKISGYDWTNNQVIKEDLSGLTIIDLLTDQGQFQYEY